MKTREKIKLAIYAAIFALLTLLDQYTKHLANVHLKNKEPFVIIKDVFEFNYLDGGNSGAAWGILAGKINYFLVTTIIICIVILILIIKIQKLINSNSLNSKKLNAIQISFIVLMAGAAGNFIDRLTNGYVVDFIYFKLINFPIFNVADCYVTCSAFVLLFICIFLLSDDDFSAIFSIKKNNSANSDEASAINDEQQI